MKPVVKCHVVESSIWAHPINIDTIDDVNGNINGNVKGNVNGNVNDNVNGNVNDNVNGNGNVNVNVNGNVNDNIKDNINNSFWLGSSELDVQSGATAGFSPAEVGVFSPDCRVRLGEVLNLHQDCRNKGVKL